MTDLATSISNSPSPPCHANHSATTAMLITPLPLPCQSMSSPSPTGDHPPPATHPHHQVTPSSSLLYARLLAVLIANGTTYLTSLHCIPSLYLYILYFIFYILYFIFFYFWHLKDYPMNCNACAMSSSWLLFAGREYSFVSLIKIFKWKFELSRHNAGARASMRSTRRDAATINIISQHPSKQLLVGKVLIYLFDC